MSDAEPVVADVEVQTIAVEGIDTLPSGPLSPRRDIGAQFGAKCAERFALASGPAMEQSSFQSTFETMNNLDARRRLLDAAIALMREGETPTTRQLAELAGVNLAAINYYFQGKDNLLAEALDEAATADVEAWLEANLDPETPPRARLETLVHFLARIHRNFHPFAHAQIRTLALHDRPERATERALAALGALCLEQHGDPRLARVQAASLMASVHYLSLFHGRFPVMTGIPVEAAEDLKAYVRDLLASLHLDGDPT